MIGTAYFFDGHTEKIILACVRESRYYTEVEFETESGRYFYRSWLEFPETLYYDDSPVMYTRPRHGFYKLEWYGLGRDLDTRLVNVPIEKIELKEKEK